jgi:hypothetical protein
VSKESFFKALNELCEFLKPFQVALVLLSVSASEAAVERSFSAQGAVHSDTRNSLHSTTVEAEMFLKFNYRAMLPRVAEDPGVIEMDDDFDADLLDLPAPSLPNNLFQVPGIDDGDDVWSTDVDEEEQKQSLESTSSDVEMEDAEPVAAAAASVRRRGRREPSIMHASLDAFIAWFIQEHNITSATVWNADLRNTLIRFSSGIPAPVPNALSIEQAIRLAAARSTNH